MFHRHSSPPHHDHHHPAPPHHHGHLPPPPPPPHHDGGQHWYSPIPDEYDLQRLESLLGNTDQAQAVFRILTACPPEIGVNSSLILRLYERLEALESLIIKKETGDETS